MGDAKSVGRIFAKALGWFVIASIVSLLLGLLLANLLHPGMDLGLPLPDIGAATNLKTASFTLKEFVTHLVPRSFAEAMANNEILQIVVFSMFFGVALAALGDIGKAMTNVIDALAHVMLKITGYVMLLAPIAVFAAMAATVATNGLEILLKFAVFMGDFYIGLIILWSLLVAAGFVFLGKRVFRLVGLIKEPFLLSFATASSEAAYPKILDSLDRFGVQRKISSFVLPMGYSFNLDGSMMYCTFATLFIAQAYNIDLPISTQLTMMAILMLTGRSVVVTTGTTNEKTMRELVAKFKINATIATAADHAESYAQLVAGKVDAFATDDVLLYGFIALNRAQDQLTVVGDFLSYDPYGIMFRKDDPQLANLVNNTLRELAASRELEQTYNKWFLRQLPTGQRLNLPMSAQLAEMIRIMGDDAATR
jgi:L-cystine uptake protein TcyP (sodium:dicarboxylate symporter family)